MRRTSSIPSALFRISGRPYAVAAVDNFPQAHVELGRIFAPRKAQLHAEYSRLITENSVILFLKHSNFSQSAMNKIRQDITALTVDRKSPSSGLNFTVIRPGIFGASLRTRYPSHLLERFKEQMGGPFAVITSPELNPPQLAKAIRLIDRAIPPLRDEDAAKPKKPISPDDIEDAPPKVKVPPRIKLVAAFVEGRFMLTDELGTVSQLPTLQTLHAQIVGLLSAPGSQLAAVLNASGGGSLLRTLQGYQKGLEKLEKSDSNNDGPESK
ncbi:uncharacterized protein EI90DRAFT_3029550 [Cantharellus anzutake]|uniref:uncharacterized protein n=1 Tax=Cantharellus anzutake TaxID=1750568 RepID=UPI001907C69B|nr:uncharacterized protein EI90DRAFT_3029550 [Cantharellus anzutake]KAF8342598.1 hypothetical protein EI90DRAFT_3029550 [Cantharellus anzutake]